LDTSPAVLSEPVVPAWNLAFRWLFAAPGKIKARLVCYGNYKGPGLPYRGPKRWNLAFRWLFGVPKRTRLFLEGRENPKLSCGCRRY
jgi:hypothetical protein